MACVSHLIQVVVWLLIPLCHFLLWRQYGLKFRIQEPCIVLDKQFESLLNHVEDSCPRDESCASLRRDTYPYIELMNSVTFDKPRAENLVEDVSYVSEKKNTVIVHRDESEPCTSYISHTSGIIHSKFCFSVVYYDNKYRNPKTKESGYTVFTAPDAARSTFRRKLDQKRDSESLNTSNIHLNHMNDTNTVHSESRRLFSLSDVKLKGDMRTGSNYLDDPSSWPEKLRGYEDYDLDYTYNLVRFDLNIDEAGQIIEPDYDYKLLAKLTSRVQSTIIKLRKSLIGSVLKLNNHNLGKRRPTGFFRTPPSEKDRESVDKKLHIFLKNFHEHAGGILDQLHRKLQANNIKAGDDMIVMVVNEGEIDLFMNFACSCQLHHIPLNNLIVFSGSIEIVKVIESTGAMALYHEGYGAVSKKQSSAYLDRIFVDMMWYKAFSIYLILRKGINVLFQDVDLVWFKNPFPYFHEYIEEHRDRWMQTGYRTEAFFSDDGQRTHRYTPYFANSGFYYLISGPRSINFAWSIMIAFAIVQSGGSHQNVFTMRLLEGMGVSYPQAKLLSMEDFPGGMMYHHNKKYMKQLTTHEIIPFHFHMCWTQGKVDKLKYFKESAMWYLTPKCSPLSSLIPRGSIYKAILPSTSLQTHPFDKNIQHQCCMMPPHGV